MLKAIWQSDDAAKLEKWGKFAGIAAAEVKSLHCSLGRTQVGRRSILLNASVGDFPDQEMKWRAATAPLDLLGSSSALGSFFSSAPPRFANRSPCCNRLERRSKAGRVDPIVNL
jgi:hypothetical protein